MRLRYQTAVVSFCLDLTDPRGYSIPVGVLLVGQSEGLGVAAATALRTDRLVTSGFLDPISSEIIGDLLALLQAHVNEAIQANDGNVDVSDVLLSLRSSLRNSLYVSSISPEQCEEVADPIGAQTFATGSVLRVLRSAIITSSNQLRERAASMEEDEAPYLLEPPPGYLPTASWPVPPFGAGLRDSHPC
ncbi:MAG: hypothetical protein KF729_06330 [Sandaracinaceae bacterium]|nr:hypothetical protein [Sandaracinaceae bacterium]